MQLKVRHVQNNYVCQKILSGKHKRFFIKQFYCLAIAVYKRRLSGVWLCKQTINAQSILLIYLRIIIYKNV